MAKPLIIFGSGEIASLAKFYFEHDAGRKVEVFTVDDEYVDDNNLGGIPIVPFSQVTKHYPPSEFDGHVALSYKNMNSFRAEKYFAMKNAGYRLASYIASSAVRWPDLVHGDNCFILENQTLQPLVKLGNNVMLWSGNHIGHGSSIGDHTYVASQTVISGHVTIGKNCFIGVNATIRDFRKIGDNVFIGMSASVTSDLADGSVVIPSADQVFDQDDRRAKMIKRTI